MAPGNKQNRSSARTPSLGTPGITAPKGFRAAGGTCGIKVSGNPDLTLIVADGPCAAAGVFTRNKVAGAPVIVNRRHLKRGRARAIVCNSGNSNSATGQQGIDNAIEMARMVARPLGFDPHEVLMNSTGVIGRQLPMDKIGRGIATLVNRLDRGPKADADAARGIMTTDLVPKSAHRSLRIGGKIIQLAGICKGSGMIAPNMATMLAFLTTDAAISPATLQKALSAASAASFNRISVDQHTSPSDTVLILASGAAGNAEISAGGKEFDAFLEGLTDLSKDLAYQIVKDGEGATKVFRVRVLNARNEKDADAIGRAVVDSPLVKTAVHGGDPNWGRITTAAGYANAKVDPERMSLDVGEIRVFERGAPLPLKKREQNKLNRVMKQKEITFTLDMGLGKASVEWLGCDLSREYITINADYTT
jgi:glutamate N-acetyltransferase/amino-acid N-acetyltransferase